MALGAMTAGVTAADWSGRLLPARQALAETGPGGLRGWDRTDCKDAYPNGYSEDRDNTGAYINRTGACFGGVYRGSNYCSSGWHRSGTQYTGDGTSYTYTPVSNICGVSTTKNAWKWTTPDGVWWRCSDGKTQYRSGGSTSTYATICRY
jgi:hypothetical protein